MGVLAGSSARAQKRNQRVAAHDTKMDLLTHPPSPGRIPKKKAMKAGSEKSGATAKAKQKRQEKLKLEIALSKTNRQSPSGRRTEKTGTRKLRKKHEEKTKLEKALSKSNGQISNHALKRNARRRLSELHRRFQEQ